MADARLPHIDVGNATHAPDQLQRPVLSQIGSLTSLSRFTSAGTQWSKAALLGAAGRSIPAATLTLEAALASHEGSSKRLAEA